MATPEEASIVGEDEHDEAAEEESDNDEECFFESLDRVPSGVSLELDRPSSESGSEDNREDDAVRISFASAMEAPRFSVCVTDFDDFYRGHEEDDGAGGFDCGIWMAEPASLIERRRRLFKGMGLTSRKDIDCSGTRPASCRSSPRIYPSSCSQDRPSSNPKSIFLPRSLSDSHLLFQTQITVEIIRSLSLPPSPWLACDAGKKARDIGPTGGKGGCSIVETDGAEARIGACKIKNLDTGKEFAVSEVRKDGTCGRLNDLQTGFQLTMDEFERFLGFSPTVKELMRRVNLGGDKKKNVSASLHQGYNEKSSKSGMRKRGGWLKNIKFVANSMTSFISERERHHGATAAPSERDYGHGKPSLCQGSSDWLKVHQHGKSYKELTGLYMCQEIQAHQGSIWCMRFNADGRFLASAGEDRSVHVWQVMESDTFSSFSTLRRKESSCLSQDLSTALVAHSQMEQAMISDLLALKRTKKRGKLGSRRRSLPAYVVLPNSIFSISKKPVCSFEGHLDDVLDLSWSKSKHLLSSSMDKTVRLWDMESRTCLKLFAHNDYVTCIQFNPINDNYFISGSLDGKVRIWSVPNRQVVDWSDLHEMVTAVSYTPDGQQGALVGSHKGNFRFYKTSDDKLSQESQVDIRNKKRKSHAKKITGFQYAPGNPSEVMVTSADSQIRVFEGVDIVHKFRGFRNRSSQISASYSWDGRYVVCASEDSNVYVWKREEGGAKSGGGGGSSSKGWVTTRSHEYFYCKDVSVALPSPSSFSSFQSSSSPSAWGLVLVTASLGGNICVYQNFGLPLSLRTHKPLPL